MVQGATSSAGKSFLCAGLCRWFARSGVRVAPFKSQNMSNNARVVEGGEIGTAQYIQALAAGVPPDVRMNPVLLKPETHTSSQVIVNGVFDRELSTLPWRGRSHLLWPHAQRALHSLLSEYELVVIEGAGSPAEINLYDDDFVNMRTAHEASAPVLVVADIDRGGAFAHLFGTWALCNDADRAQIQGFILNKFRGDSALLAPAPQLLAEMTGVPTLGVMPWIEHCLPDEDGVSIGQTNLASDAVIVGIVGYPTASNLDEFKPLEQIVKIVWVRNVETLKDVDFIVLPGSKHVSSDLAWLRSTGIADKVVQLARTGARILGICGGLQMLGEQLVDEADVDGNAVGLGLLPLTTKFKPEKRTVHVGTRFEAMDEPWKSLSGIAFSGYEIRHGKTSVTAPVNSALAGGLGYVKGSILAVYTHGLFESSDVVRALFSGVATTTLDDTFEQLADALDENLEMSTIARLAMIAM
ncbi:MAG: cobyric acid synthase [Actinomycetota bacterium]